MTIQLCQELYSMLREGQKDFFNKMYKSIDNIKMKYVMGAIQQCENTIILNQKEEANAKED